MPIQPNLTTHVQEAPRRDAHDLRNYLDQFIQQNAHTRDVEHRWLAMYAKDLMVQAYNVKAGNHDTIKAQVEAFRLDEIRVAREELAKQDRALETEANKLKATE